MPTIQKFDMTLGNMCEHYTNMCLQFASQVCDCWRCHRDDDAFEAYFRLAIDTMDRRYWDNNFATNIPTASSHCTAQQRFVQRKSKEEKKICSSLAVRVNDQV
jgi:hypothetical protein